MTLIHGVEISCRHRVMGGYPKPAQNEKVIRVLGYGFSDIETMHSKLAAIQANRENARVCDVRACGKYLKRPMDEDLAGCVSASQR